MTICKKNLKESRLWFTYGLPMVYLWWTDNEKEIVHGVTVTEYSDLESDYHSMDTLGP